MTSAGAKAGAATNSRVGLLLRGERLFKGTDTVERRDEPNKLAAKPKEGLLEVIVGLCGNFKVLEVLLAMECDSASLHFALLSRGKLVSIRDREDEKNTTFTSTLLPHNTMGMFSQTRSRSRCQLGTFL